jgi:hypothetical protein
MGGCAQRLFSRCGLALFAAAYLPIGPSAHLCAQSSLTIYNDGRVLVRRGFAAKVPKGSSAHWLGVGRLDPSSLISLDPAVRITEARYDADVSEQSVLRRAIGRTFEVHTG